MIAAKTLIGSDVVLIEAVSDSVQIAGEVTGRQTQVTGIDDNLKDAYTKAKSIITTMAGDFADFLQKTIATGQKVEMEFSLGLSASSGFWVISGKGEFGIKVKMSWVKP